MFFMCDIRKDAILISAIAKGLLFPPPRHNLRLSDHLLCGAGMQTCVFVVENARQFCVRRRVLMVVWIYVLNQEFWHASFTVNTKRCFSLMVHRVQPTSPPSRVWATPRCHKLRAMPDLESPCSCVSCERGLLFAVYYVTTICARDYNRINQVTEDSSPHRHRVTGGFDTNT